MTDQNTYKTRIVCATSLFDGHDAAINIMRRMMQNAGAEVIYLGHNRSAEEIVRCAIQEDAQGIAITSYQGGHNEFFKYMYDLLKKENAAIKIVGGGGGTILPEEIKDLHLYGIQRIYSPDDGRKMGLEGMIKDVMKHFDFSTLSNFDFKNSIQLDKTQHQLIAKLISLAENSDNFEKQIQQLPTPTQNTPVVGITGTGGAGKSSLTDELLRRILAYNPAAHIAIISIDPSKRKSGGALLGDRIRMNTVGNPRIYMRSMATRNSNVAISSHLSKVIEICKKAAFDLIIVETSGIGQSGSEITELCDVSLYVMTPEYGAATQLEKIDMIDFADIIAINKYDKAGGEDAVRDVAKQYRRSRQLWDEKNENIPVFSTIASLFNNLGMHRLYNHLCKKLNEKSPATNWKPIPEDQLKVITEKRAIIPAQRINYLGEITALHREYKKYVTTQSTKASRLYQLQGALESCKNDPEVAALLDKKMEALKKEMDAETLSVIEHWDEVNEFYQKEYYEYPVRDKVIKLPLHEETLSGLRIPKIAIPSISDWGDRVKWKFLENFPGRFPYTAGVFPLKRTGESPARMFAGEGGAERTNRRFHYLSQGQAAKRLSTAFDSVTLYGEDPDIRPDIYGKIGNSGVNIATLDEIKKLYSGFDLCAPDTSVSMTINGPAPAILALFLNAAIDQQCEKYIIENGLVEEVKTKIKNTLVKDGIKLPTYNGVLPENHNQLGLMLLGTTGDQVLPIEVYNSIKSNTLQQVRGTVQADILKEDQAQNTCIFSTEFALRMMGDIQSYFITEKIKNFYSVSISGYHIAEAGANPITQLAFTLANGFTFVEYYLARGMNIDDFAPNLSFFFSNGLDAEYAVIGRVARRIWAKAIRYLYKGNERSQKLKYHIQTSGRSLHAQEIAFNDIRTTLQALYAIYDNCNSLHTNAYDEAITTPTEESVRRALAIQLIIDKELGLSSNENTLQGAYIIETLTDLVEEAVMKEFDRINERGGVLAAMERMYQRSKIQEESMYYEGKKHNGDLPIIGVNTFLDPKGSPTIIPSEVIRATIDEKDKAIESLHQFQQRNKNKSDVALQKLTSVAKENANVFEALMETVKYCSLGQITNALYEVGGQYRRNM